MEVTKSVNYYFTTNNKSKLQKRNEKDHKKTKITANDNKQNGKSKTQTRNITKYKQQKHTKDGWIYDSWIYDFIVKLRNMIQMDILLM